MLQLREGKMSRKQIYKLAEDNYKVTSEVAQCAVDRMAALDFLIGLSDIIRNDGLGQPLNTMPEFESNPGVWILDDTETGEFIMVFSDSYRKNAFKGTSIETPTPNAALFKKTYDHFNALTFDIDYATM